MTKITGMTIKRGAPNKGGSRIMAFFNAHNEEMGFKGCALVLRPDGGWRVWTPMLSDLTRTERREREAAVYFRSGSTMEAELLEAALKLYAIINGDAPEADNDNDEGLRRLLAVEDSLKMAGID